MIDEAGFEGGANLRLDSQAIRDELARVRPGDRIHMRVARIAPSGKPMREVTGMTYDVVEVSPGLGSNTLEVLDPKENIRSTLHFIDSSASLQPALQDLQGYTVSIETESLPANQVVVWSLDIQRKQSGA